MKKFISVFLALLVCFSLCSAFAEEPDNESVICGKWSFYWDASALPDSHKNVLDFSVLSYELYLFPDGSASMTNMTIDKKGKMDFSFGALEGVWIGDPSSLVIRMKTSTYKAFIEDGILKLYMIESIFFPFERIDQSEAMYQQAVH